MTNPAAIVGRINRIESPIEEAFAANQRVPDAAIIHFDNGRRARLDPVGPLAEAYAQALGDLWSTRDQVYVEVDPTGTINRLLLPMSVKVKSLTPTASGEVEVELEISHAGHFLSPEVPFFEDMLDMLTRARAENSSVLVTETRDDHVIIDVREMPGPFAQMPLGEPEEDAVLNFSSLRAIEPDRARELFDIINAKTCRVFGRPASCIPFLYPDSGCEGRAHAMFFAIRDEGEEFGKVWVDYDRRRDIPTPNNPCCQVPWVWHVVPVVKVTVEGTAQPWVIDPSLFCGPVHLDTWLAAQGGSNGATLSWTAAWVFYRYPIPVPGKLQDIEEVLRKCRTNLFLRSSEIGPPPYERCYERCP